MKKRVGIIGGGASGLFAACQLRRLSGGSDIEVTVLEKNSVPGKKLILTGHGRCNITNRKDVNKLKEGYHDADKFLYPALREFGPEDTVRLFENEIGLETGLFPISQAAQRQSVTAPLRASGRPRNLRSTRPRASSRSII